MALCFGTSACDSGTLPSFFPAPTYHLIKLLSKLTLLLSMKFVLKSHEVRDLEATDLELPWRLLIYLGPHHPKLCSPEVRGKASIVLKYPRFPESGG